MNRFVSACQAFWRTLTGAPPPPAAKSPASAPQAAKAAPAPVTPAAPPPPDRFAEGAVYTLLLLQREARLVDFLMEDLSGVDDEQLGAASRRIHADCAKVLRETFQPAPVLSQPEGERLTLPADSDMTRVRLTGQVPAQPPYAGTLQHRGWRAQAVSLPQRTGKVDPQLIQPAELEC